MDMLTGDQIADAGLSDWRKLAQGNHARFVVDDFSPAAGSSWPWASGLTVLADPAGNRGVLCAAVSTAALD